MSANELRQAAETLRRVAGAANRPPWKALPPDGLGRGDGFDVIRDSSWNVMHATDGPSWLNVFGPSFGRDAEYVATMHPGVGLALADWLDDEAGRSEMAAADGLDARLYEPALRIARLINGGAA